MLSTWESKYTPNDNDNFQLVNIASTMNGESSTLLSIQKNPLMMDTVFLKKMAHKYSAKQQLFSRIARTFESIISNEWWQQLNGTKRVNFYNLVFVYILRVRECRVVIKHHHRHPTKRSDKPIGSNASAVNAGFHFTPKTTTNVTNLQLRLLLLSTKETNFSSPIPTTFYIQSRYNRKVATVLEVRRFS